MRNNCLAARKKLKIVDRIKIYKFINLYLLVNIIIINNIRVNITNIINIHVFANKDFFAPTGKNNFCVSSYQNQTCKSHQTCRRRSSLQKCTSHPRTPHSHAHVSVLECHLGLRLRTTSRCLNEKKSESETILRYYSRAIVSL